MPRTYLLSVVSLSSAEVFDVTSYGARDGEPDSTEGVQAAFDAVKRAGGSGHTVLFPNGTFTFGPVKFESLDSATIEFTDGAKLESLQDKSKWETDSKGEYVPWIRGEGCTDLTVKGGTFDHHHDYWLFAKKPDIQTNLRPYLMEFKKMTGFTIHDGKLLNSPHTHLKISASTDVEVYNMHLETTLDSQNTDGIMLSSVIGGHVHDNFVQNGDDCMKANDACRDVLYERSTCVGGHGLSIGGGSSKLDIQNITFRDFDLQDMASGSRIKFTRKTTGSLRNVTYQDLRMKHVKRPLHINTGYESSVERALASPAAARFSIEDVYYLDIHAVDDLDLGATQGGGGNIKSPGTFLCDETAPCRSLHLRNVTMETETEWYGESAGGWADARVSPDASSIFEAEPQTDVVVV